MKPGHIDAVYKRWRTVLVASLIAFVAGAAVFGWWRGDADGAVDWRVFAENLWTALSSYGAWLVAANALLVGALVLMDSRHGERTLSWLFVLALVPVLGLVAYWILGPDLRQARRRWRFRKSRADRRSEAVDDPGATAFDGMGMETLWRNMGARERDYCEKVEAFFDGAALFDRMLEDISRARREVLVLFYIFRDDGLGRRLRDALVERARAGLRVRLVVDAVGGGGLRKRFFEETRAAGVEVRLFHPVSLPFLRGYNYRNHRKIVAVDGRVGYVGGFNVGDEYLGLDAKMGPWFDAHLRLTGAATESLREVFWSDWAICGDAHEHEHKHENDHEIDHENDPPARQATGSAEAESSEDAKGGESAVPVADLPEVARGAGEMIPVRIVASGPDMPWDAIHRGYFALVGMARDRIWIATPYLVPGAALMTALTTAALAGVDVRVAIPGKPDSRLVYWCTLDNVEELLRAGVRVYRYAPERFMHAKAAVVDGRHVTVGTANWDARSMEINFEVQAFVSSGELAARMEAAFSSMMDDSELLDLEAWSSRGPRARVCEGIGRLIAPLA